MDELLLKMHIALNNYRYASAGLSGFGSIEARRKGARSAVKRVIRAYERSGNTEAANSLRNQYEDFLSPE